MTRQPTNDRTNGPSKDPSLDRGDRAQPASRPAHLTPPGRGPWEGRSGKGSSFESRGLGTAIGPKEPVDLLEEQAASRVPELVPVRYGRMLASPFAFYRGGLPHGRGPRLHAAIGDQRPGLRRRARLELRPVRVPERELLFDINDFDETLPGPWEWDVKRLAASLAVAGRNNGFSDASAAR